MDDPLPVCSRLTLGLPGPTDELVRSWIGRRLVWWPNSIPSRPWLSVISSRLCRPLFEQTEWFGKLRSACELARVRGDTLVFATKTSTARFLERCGCLYEIPTLRIEVAPENQPVDRWLGRCLQSDRTAGKRREYAAHVSPLLSDYAALAPTRDALAIGVADRIVALQTRARGNMQRLLSHRQAYDGLEAVTVHQSHVPRDVVAKPSKSRRVPVIPVDQAPEGWLLHWTRRHDAPWPGESVEHYLDALIMGLPESNHSALATLRRIVQQRRLRASSKGIRGGFPVVCFSAAPLEQLAVRRVFRPHRRRWDFEPYGIYINIDWLRAVGARPVTYGDDELWNRLTVSERPFFQKQSSQSSQIDWSSECEWRHIGDIDLELLPADAAALFVPKIEDAEDLAETSPWPIVVLATEDNQPDRSL